MSLLKKRIHIGSGPDGFDLSVKQAGQIMVIFALMLTTLIGMVGIAIDVTYAWRNGLQIQRAADAAAMSGVVYLPGSIGSGRTKALAIASANGYGPAGVTADYAPGDNRKMDVTITAQVPTFFIRIFGMNNWTISRSARAAYVLPVPMGSPLAYMGVGCYVLKTGQPVAPGCQATGNGQSGVTADNSAFTGSNSLGSLGAWGAISAPGGDEGNGDAYAPTNNGTGSNPLFPKSPTGADGYKGYFYTVKVAGGGAVKIFDAAFCAMGAPASGAGGNYGAGDHWVGGASTDKVSTYYNLFNTNGQPFNQSAWSFVSGSGPTFQNQNGSDTTNGGPSGGSACDALYHNKWWTFASNLGAGTYELEVTTTNVDPNTVFSANPSVTAEASDTTGAQNMFALEVSDNGSGATGPTVYGYDKMAVYNNLAATGVIQKFYIAQVDQPSGIGKTLTIDLFDIGDSTAGTIQILSPDTGGSPFPATFDYSTYNYNASLQRVSPGNCVAYSYSPCTGHNVTSITVKGASGSSFNNTWIEITIPMLTYGSGGLWSPPGLTPAQPGWWQVQYNVTAGSDLTTWSVNVNGNPVHLVPIP